MKSLCFVLPPYPDEIGGSWLGRNALHNGVGAWREAWTKNGERTNPVPADFDMIDFTPQFNSFVEHLGLTYERYLLDLSTLRYWLAFGSRPLSDGVIPGTIGVPFPYNSQSVRSPIVSLRHLGRISRARCGNRYCPECLREDVSNFGEPYWHRAHQLPNVYCCTTHQVRLRTACPRCGRAPSISFDRNVVLSRTLCPCGFDHRQSDPALETSDIWLRLATVSREVLAADWQSTECSTIRKLLSDRLWGQDCSSVLADVYDSETLRRSTQETIPGYQRLSFSRSFRWVYQARSPECCALLAALDCDLQSALEGRLGVSERVRPGRQQQPITAPSIRISKAKLLERKRSFNALRPSSGGMKIHYWNTRIFEPDWLIQHFPNTSRQNVPSINDDRRQIRDKLAGLIRNSKAAWSTISDSTSGLRARIRDGAWLEKQRCKYKATLTSQLRESTEKKSTRHSGATKSKPTSKRNRRVVIPHVLALTRALESLLTEIPPPKRITLMTLAERGGISYNMARRAVTFELKLKGEILRSKQALKTRRLAWALQQLTISGELVTVDTLLRSAGMGTSSACRAMARGFLYDP